MPGVQVVDEKVLSDLEQKTTHIKLLHPATRIMIRFAYQYKTIYALCPVKVIYTLKEV